MLTISKCATCGLLPVEYPQHLSAFLPSYSWTQKEGKEKQANQDISCNKLS